MKILILIFLINQSIGELINLKNLPHSILYVSNLSSFNSSKTWSRLYSNQLNDQQLAKYFKIVNKTSIEITKQTSSESFCMSINSCNFQTNKNQCILDLNLIIYLNNENKSSFNEIKLVKLSLILSDWTRDYLLFDQLNYEFNFNIRSEGTGDMHEFGLVKAQSIKNSDLNNLVKYYIEFKEKDKIDLLDLIKINEQTGSLILNRTKLMHQKYASEYIFYVDGVVKCSQNQRPLHNRTLVKLNLIDSQKTRPVINLISLVEQKKINTHKECFRLTHSDLFLSEKIALAQLQIENFDLKESYDFQIQQTGLNLKIENLIDNLFVVYLLNSSFDQNFMSEIFRVNFKLTNGDREINSEFYVCLNVANEQELYEELSMVSFEHNVIISTTDEQSIVLEAESIGSKNLNFILDPTLDEESNFKLEKISKNSIKVVLDRKQELLAYETIVLAFDSSISIDRFLKMFSYLKQISSEYKKFLKFSSKIIFNSENYNQKINQFNSNKKILGYLPSIVDLVPIDHFMKFDNSIKNYYYKLNDNDGIKNCVHIQKFSGILVQSCQNKTKNEKISFSLENSDPFYRLDKFSPIEFSNISNQSIDLKVNSTLAKNVFNLNFEINFNRLNIDHKEIIEIIRLESQENDTVYYPMSQISKLFTLDQKLGSLGLNLTNFYSQTTNILFNKCFKFDITSKSYVYSSPLDFKMKSNDMIELNLCFSINTDQDGFLRSSVSSGFSFQFLRAQNLNKSLVWISFMSLFITMLALLTGVLFYMCWVSRYNMKKQFSSSSECQLKIRNDDLYQSIENGLVPSKLDILLNKKPLSPDTSNLIEVSSIREISEDQGVYCVATGTSFTSNLSSASECVDTVSETSDLSCEIVLGKMNVEKTRLTLFEMTPVVKHKLIDEKCVCVDGKIGQSDIKQWLQSSQEIVQIKNSKSNFSIDTQGSTISSNECII